jgi:hypothetical protein
MLTLEQFGIIVAIVVGVGNFLFTLYKEIHKDSIEFLLQRFKESVEKPVKSSWSIRVIHPNKLIEKCIVLYNGVQLPWWNSGESLYYQRTIVVGGGGNVRIPIEIEKENAEVKIMDGKKTLKRREFKEIPIAR